MLGQVFDLFLGFAFVEQRVVETLQWRGVETFPVEFGEIAERRLPSRKWKLQFFQQFIIVAITFQRPPRRRFLWTWRGAQQIRIFWRLWQFGFICLNCVIVDVVDVTYVIVVWNWIFIVLWIVWWGKFLVFDFTDLWKLVLKLRKKIWIFLIYF